MTKILTSHVGSLPRTQETVDFNELLLELMEIFQKALPDAKQHVTLSLFPYTVSDTTDYQHWMNTLLNLGLAEKTRLMVFDHRPENYFEPIQLKHKEISKSLFVDLDIDAAMKKIALLVAVIITATVLKIK